MRRQNYSQTFIKNASDGLSKTDTCLKWTDFYALSAYFTYVRRHCYFSWETKEKGLDYKKKRSFFFKSFIFYTKNFFFSYHIYVMQCFFNPFMTDAVIKKWDYNAGNKLRLKTFSLQNVQCSWYIRFVYLYPKAFLYSLHPILHLLLMDNSQKSHKLKK